jgi:hypothetical protein
MNIEMLIIKHLNKIRYFIDANRYTYKVEDVIEEYKSKYGKCYISHTMNHCITNLVDSLEILEILEIELHEKNKKYEKNILKNYIGCMTKAYRLRTINWCVVRDILLNGTSTAGKTSSINKCIELDIDPYSYDLDRGTSNE